MIKIRRRHPAMLIGMLTIALILSACGGSGEAPAVSNAESGLASVSSASGGDFSCSPGDAAQSSYQSPAQVTRSGHDYTATVTMENGGQIVIELFEDEAPITTNNFIFLACEGFYDGVTFHRVLPGFVAQGGDPTGTGRGGPGYTIAHEAQNDLDFDRPGLLSMAHTMQPNSTGSQFFITFAPVPQLDADFTVFGEVVAGADVVESITPRDPQINPDAPPGDVIQSIRVVETPR